MKEIRFAVVWISPDKKNDFVEVTFYLSPANES